MAKECNNRVGRESREHREQRGLLLGWEKKRRPECFSDGVGCKMEDCAGVGLAFRVSPLTEMKATVYSDEKRRNENNSMNHRLIKQLDTSQNALRLTASTIFIPVSVHAGLLSVIDGELNMLPYDLSSYRSQSLCSLLSSFYFSLPGEASFTSANNSSVEGMKKEINRWIKNKMGAPQKFARSLNYILNSD